MGKFASTRPAPTSPVRTDPDAPATRTYEGAAAVVRDARSELFITAATNMVGEDTFYESARDKDARFRQLARQVAREDPAWVRGFLPFLRDEMNMRSASVVLAAEAADVWRHEGVPGSRALIASALRRPDEPAELLAYWRARFGRAVPSGVQRGVADALRALLTERAAIKYDGQRNAWRLGDVIEVAHPKPRAAAYPAEYGDCPVCEAPAQGQCVVIEGEDGELGAARGPHKGRSGTSWQSALFGWLLDRRRHSGDGIRADLTRLPTVAAFEELVALPTGEQRAALLEYPERLAACGLTWEYLAGLGPMDARAWQAVIPVMGYMALLRNLRNFDEAGVPDDVAEAVAARLADPEQVARSRQFPYRFLSAYDAAPSLRWAHALDKALSLSCSNMPELPGRTLILFDTSASMEQTVSGKSQMTHLKASAVLAVALARRNAGRVDLIGFADDAFVHELTPGGGLLREIDAIRRKVGTVGHGTNMLPAVAATYKAHDRVVILSDMQAAPYLGVGRGRSTAVLYGGTHRVREGALRDVVPAPTPVFAVNTAGYRGTVVEAGEPGLHEIAGFSDRLFTMIGTLSGHRSTGWPWEVTEVTPVTA